MSRSAGACFGDVREEEEWNITLVRMDHKRGLYQDRQLIDDFQDAIKNADSESRACGMARRSERTMQIETVAVVLFGLIAVLLGFVLLRKPKQA